MKQKIKPVFFAAMPLCCFL